LVAVAIIFAVMQALPRWGTAVRLHREERRGDIHFQKGESAEAEACWRRILAERPRHVSARNKLAVIRMQYGEFERARELLDEGLRLLPLEVSFHYNMGLALYMASDYDGALVALDRVVRANPEHGKVHFLKGVIYEAQGRHDLAQEEFVQELNVDPATPDAWVKLGVLPGAEVKSWLMK